MYDSDKPTELLVSSNDKPRGRKMLTSMSRIWFQYTESDGRLEKPWLQILLAETKGLKLLNGIQVNQQLHSCLQIKSYNRKRTYDKLEQQSHVKSKFMQVSPLLQLMNSYFLMSHEFQFSTLTIIGHGHSIIPSSQMTPNFEFQCFPKIRN